MGNVKSRSILMFSGMAILLFMFAAGGLMVMKPITNTNSKNFLNDSRGSKTTADNSKTSTIKNVDSGNSGVIAIIPETSVPKSVVRNNQQNTPKPQPVVHSMPATGPTEDFIKLILTLSFVIYLLIFNFKIRSDLKRSF